MRDSPFITANEPPRLFGEVLAERRQMDPRARAVDAAMNEIERLEGEAFEANKDGDLATAKRKQCEAEGLRAAIHETGRS